MKRKEKIVEAARSGSVESLHRLLEGNDETLEMMKSSYWCPENPLHLASAFGHLEFAKEYLLKLSSSSSAVSLIFQLNREGYTPLHLASANGHIEMVRFLLDEFEEVEEICLVKGRDGRNALHCAVINGKDGVIALLLGRCSEAALDTTNDNETALHLALKHNHLEAFRLLIHRVRFCPNLLNLQDSHLGNTVLHLAAEKEDLQIMKELLEQQVHVNILNNFGCTALDVIARPPTNFTNEYMEKLIKSAGGIMSGKIPNQRVRDLNDIRNAVLVMTSLFATVSFGVALTAPGGLWQDWGSSNTIESGSGSGSESDLSSVRHVPGTSILYDLHRTKFIFSCVLACNAMAFISSIATIVLLLQPFNYVPGGAYILWSVLGLALSSTTIEFFTIMSLTTGWNWGPLAVGIIFIGLAISVFCNRIYYNWRIRTGRK